MPGHKLWVEEPLTNGTEKNKDPRAEYIYVYIILMTVFYLVGSSPCEWS